MMRWPPSFNRDSWVWGLFCMGVAVMRAVIQLLRLFAPRVLHSLLQRLWELSGW